MRKHVLTLAKVFLLVFAHAALVLGDNIVWEEIGGSNLDLRTVLTDPGNPRSVYIGSNNAVFKTEDGGESWRNILSIRGNNRAVNFLSFDPGDKNSLYAATGNGLFLSTNQGKDWRRVFRGRNYLENECTTMAALPFCSYLGTRGGLFINKGGGTFWQKEDSSLGQSHIFAIAYDIKEQNRLYAACAEGVFKTEDGGQSWEKIFAANSIQEEKNNDIQEEPDEQEGACSSGIRHLAIDPDNSSYLYLATSRGVYISRDRGEIWEPLSTFGLLDRDVKFLLVSSGSRLYAVTKNGIFEYKDERWHELSLGLPAAEINFLSLDKNDLLYAATDKGLFKAVYSNSGGKGGIISSYYKSEPRIDEVRQAAIKYAEVEPEKIARWRKQAAKKALLPQLNVGIDRNSSDLWHWEGGSTSKIDDDVLRRGRASIDWNVSLNWNLGELIWNDDQTSIDVRSRLMVELRDSLLDEVTKLYFERIRVKMEINNLAIEDNRKRAEKELKLQELTASLDSLTGGYFSSRLNPGAGA
ncbi:MAG: hypothetical protein PHE18_06535 [Candidatus Omnitrophica bacterium]|nr:hypothetical protein [Candidatus Omnitrophota bacterium]MDD5553515.1 hypothetical protein [Candidatus Omnitrophota bacterium]